MANVNEIFTDIANAIRKKGGSTDKMKPSDMASKINELPSPSMKCYFDANPNGGYYFAWQRKGDTTNNITSAQLKKCLSYSDTQNVTNMSYMFCECSSLTSVPELDTSKVTNMAYMFDDCYKLTEINMINIACNLDVSSTALKHDALIKLINNLKSGVTSKTLKMGSSKLALLSDEEKKVATDKGWTLA